MRAMLGLVTFVMALFVSFTVAANNAAAYETLTAVKAEVAVSDEEQAGFEEAQSLFAETLKKPYFQSKEYKDHLAKRAEVYGNPENVTKAEAESLRKEIDDALIYPWFTSEGSGLAKRQATYLREYSQRDPGLDHTLRLLIRQCQGNKAGDEWLAEGGFERDDAPAELLEYAKGLDDIQAQAGDACPD